MGNGCLNLFFYNVQQYWIIAVVYTLISPFQDNFAFAKPTS